MRGDTLCARKVNMTEASQAVVSDISSRIPPIGMTLTQDEGEAIMERVRANVMGAVHAGWVRNNLDGLYWPKENDE
jgi:hypothetical protein